MSGSIFKTFNDKRIVDLLDGYMKFCRDGIIHFYAYDNNLDRYDPFSNPALMHEFIFRTNTLEGSFLHWVINEKDGTEAQKKYLRTLDDIWFLKCHDDLTTMRFWTEDFAGPEYRHTISFGGGDGEGFLIKQDRDKFKRNDIIVEYLQSGLNKILELKAAFFEEYCRENHIDYVA